ncbi:sensor histidine kinase [Xaviernesmea oryzae]|nr:PAS domain-containing sensor histidine kinase [Xaviernesmea oryzae]SEM21629.1 Two-component sensor histidine kinase, contains HisKA and HATPase domains [Xaviernesmea oryzae]
MLQSTSECALLFQQFDWASSPLGPVDGWSPELRTLVDVTMNSLQPMLIVWGPEQIILYNDGYARMCGNRHPGGFGHPFRDLWYDIWDQVDPIISAAYAGHGTSMDDIEFIMHRNGFPEETHFAFSYTPVRDPTGAVLGMFCACTETTADVRLRREQVSERERLLRIFELSPAATAALTGPNHVFDFANAAFAAMIGDRDVIGRPAAEALPALAQAGLITSLDAVYRSGMPLTAHAMPLMLETDSAHTRGKRLIDLICQPMRDPSGAMAGILLQTQDVTEQLAEEEHRNLLARELAHRLKNQLAMVQAIVSQTLRSAGDITSARRALGDRLAVLGAAHDMIIKGGANTSTMAEVVAQMTQVHDDKLAPRIQVDGPPLRIAARPTLSLSLILHELATNASKYGALSVPSGRVQLNWDLSGPNRDRVEISWTEHAGPPVAMPQADGTGSKLIKAGLSGTQDCQVEIAFHPMGLHCRICADLKGFESEH